ncbi:MAG: sugar ABC transporter ATP-binding protein [Thermoflexales bacterium]|nr:sugar ABC transporter ATP-binding protein [Thermoflexales bacterium]
MLRAVDVSKRFDGVVALDGVSFEVHAGQIHALVGANGAGKSTLIKVLSGYYDSYGGHVELDGKPVSLHRPSDAIRAGIEVVHQEVDTALVPTLSVAENVLIEHLAERASGLWIDWQHLRRESSRAMRRVGLEVNPARAVETLSLHEKQLLLIARAVRRKARFLILDEPTASLSLREAQLLFELLRDLARAGVGIVYISHRLGEVRELADVVTVLRAGRVAGRFQADAPTEQIIEAMLGTATSDLYPERPTRGPGEVVLEARGLRRQGSVEDVSFIARRGEILGITGLVGAGKTELLRLLFGADPLDGGALYLNGRLLRLRQPSDAVKAGIYLVPEERRRHGLLIESTVRENTTLPFLDKHTRWGWLSRRSELQSAERLTRLVGLTPPLPELPVKNLSGGNQQKVVIGRWFDGEPKAVLFDEATQGIDVRAKRDVFDLVHQWSQRAAVIYASSDIDEVMALADRVLVMRDGRVVAEVNPRQVSREAVLALATGVKDSIA